MIVIEGCDGSGKTTLVNELVRRYGLTVGERGVKDRDKLWEATRADTRRALAEAVRGDKPPTVWDRLFYSDFIYAPATGRSVAFPQRETRLVEGVMDALRCPLIICHVDLDLVRENVTKDKQMDGVVDNLEAIWHGYQSLSVGSHPLVTTPQYTMVYDYTRTGAIVEVDRMLNGYASYRKERNAS